MSKCFCHFNGYEVKDAKARNDIENLKNEKYIMIGDSYGVGYTPDGNVTSWCDKLANLLKLSNNDYYKFCSPGAGFVATGTGGKTFLQVLSENISNITDKDSIDKIVVCGGYNDANYNSSYSSIISAIQTFTNYCNDNFVNAKIYIGCIGYNTNNNLDGASIRNKLSCIVLPAYSTTPNVINPPLFLKNSNLILHKKSYFSSDGFHPNSNGQDRIACKIFEGLKGEISIHNEVTQIYTTLSNGGTSGNLGTTNEILGMLSLFTDNSIFTYLADNATITYNPGITVKGNQNIDLGTYETTDIFPAKNTTFNIPVKCLITSGASENEICDSTLIFATDGHLYLNVKILDNNSWKTIDNVIQIIIYSFGYNNSPIFN